MFGGCVGGRCRSSRHGDDEQTTILCLSISIMCDLWFCLWFITTHNNLDHFMTFDFVSCNYRIVFDAPGGSSADVLCTLEFGSGPFIVIKNVAMWVNVGR